MTRNSSPDGGLPISAPIAIEFFETLADEYSTLFLDAYGVLKNSSGVLHGVLPLLRRLQQRGIGLFVITNDASKSPAQMARSYEHPEYGALLRPDQIICSGRLAQRHLRQSLAPGKVAYFGKPNSAHFITEAGHEAVPIGRCNSVETVDAIAFLDDEGFEWSRSLTVALNMLRRREVPVLVANSDSLYPVDHQEMGIAVGSLASLLEGLVDGNFLRFGKPDPSLFAHAFSVAAEKSPGLRKSEVLMVGDTVRTDIRGANSFGIDAALVLSGNTEVGGNSLQEQATALDCPAGSRPRYLCRSVVSGS